MKRGTSVLHGLLLFITAALLAVCPETVRAEEIPSAENTDGGSVSLNLVHYQAQSLTLSLDTPHLAFQDVTLDCTDAATGEPVSISLLADPGTSDYTLYDLETPLEELSGTLNISMITEPGYELDLDQTVFRIDGQTYTNGSTAVLHSSSASVTSSVTCSEMTLPEAPAEPETPVQPEHPAEPETPADPQTPSQPETPAEPETPVQPQTPVQEETTQTAHNSTSGTAAAVSETQSQTVSSGNPVAAEILETVPVAEAQTAAAQPQQQTAPDSNSAAASVSSAETAETIRETAGQKPEQNVAVTAETTSETSELHLADITRRLNLVLAVLLLIVLILLLTKLILTLKREKRHHRYRHYRFR